MVLQNPDDAQAADRFYALKEAYDLLAAPDKRAAYDAKRASEAKRAERFNAIDGKRKADLADLHAREEAFKRSKTTQMNERSELERIKEQNAQLMRERASATNQPSAPSTPRPEAEEPTKAKTASSSSKLGEHDTKVTLKWSSSLSHPAFADPALLSAEITSLCGPVNDIATLPKRKAIVEFARLTSAVKAVDMSDRRGTVFEGVAVAWLAGHPPASVVAARARGTLPPATTRTPPRDEPRKDSAKEEEKRRAERARLAEEMRRQDEEEERVGR